MFGKNKYLILVVLHVFHRCGGESVPISKIGRSDGVALNSYGKLL